MPGQVHAVVQQPQHIDVLIFDLTKHHKVMPTSALARHVQGADARPDVISRFDTQPLWPIMQCLDGQSQRLSVNLSLALTKVLMVQAMISEIQLRLRSQAEFPDYAHAGAVALLATDLRWSRSDTLVSKDLNRPGAISAAPSCTAARSASSR